MTFDLPWALRAAERKAADLIEQYGIDSPEHIRLEDIAYDLGVGVVEGPLKGAAARLVRFQKKAVIRVCDTEGYSGRKRFSIAHELGHFLLSRGHSLERVCGDMDLHDWYQTEGDETVANAFAGELLLPRSLIEKQCDVREVNFEPVRAIAEAFRTSLTATAIRFVRFCPELCAIVFSTKSKVKWVCKSEDFWPYIQRGKALDKRTFAYDFFQGEELPDNPQDVEAEAWLDSERLSGAQEVVEHSVALPRLRSVLTLLWIRP
jgi:Zn-dependent peptidase ImmA (M78 family)